MTTILMMLLSTLTGYLIYRSAIQAKDDMDAELRKKNEESRF